MGIASTAASRAPPSSPATRAVVSSQALGARDDRRGKMGTCFSCVDQSTVAFIAQFGKFSRIAYPGFNCVHCYLGESVVGQLSLRVQQLDVRCETKTKVPGRGGGRQLRLGDGP